jgi:rhamnogalacturonyl hydrolase YesR
MKKLEVWIEDRNFKGYEPFDGMFSFLRIFTFRNIFMERLLIQLIRQSPVNLRPLLGVKPHASTKGRGYMAWGYLKLFKLFGDDDYKKKAEKSLRWLMENTSPSYQEYCWGNHFDFSGRSGRVPKFEPTIVWSSLIGQAFLDAYELLQQREYLEVADNICKWILKLPRERTGSGACLSYVAYKQSSVHNSNMLGAAMLARTARHTGNRDAMEVAKEAMEFSCTRQLPDGAWKYGINPNTHWIDNFHTGYNLDSLKIYIENTGDRDYYDNLRRGFGYYKQIFFERNGRPKYYHNRAYPIDIQCASQAIDTLTNFSIIDQESLEMAKKVAKWTIGNMQDKTGFFYYRVLPSIKVKIPMMHWGQATMYKALSSLMSVI